MPNTRKWRGAAALGQSVSDFDELERECGAEYVEFETLLRESDVPCPQSVAGQHEVSWPH